MSLPNGFHSSSEYFQHVIEFLKQNSWIYKEANTGFLEAGVLEQMPQEYKDYFGEIETEELNQFPYVHQTLRHLKVHKLINFRHNLVKLIPLDAYAEPKVAEKQIKCEILKKMNVKKQHEIQRLAALVKQVLNINEKDDNNEEQKKHVLIDFGSGLGYLSELLYKLDKNLLVLGLESDLHRVEAAKKRVQTYKPTAFNSIQYRQHFITENSEDFILKSVDELFKLTYQHMPQQITTKMTIIGLHACADLTITSMKLFFQLTQVHQLIIMPCCYHKLEMCDDSAAPDSAASKFRNFPISESLKEVLLENDNANYVKVYTSYLNRPFLRLASQQTLKRWSKCTEQQHYVHAVEMFYRAVAETITKRKESDLIVVKLKENKNIQFSSLSAEEVKSFETFSNFYALKTKTSREFVPWSDSHQKRFDEVMEMYPNGCKLAEGLTCLQTSMQKLCENLILYDRLCYMEETALKMNLKIKVKCEKLMDEELSPRCYVLIAEKL